MAHVSPRVAQASSTSHPTIVSCAPPTVVRSDSYRREVDPRPFLAPSEATPAGFKFRMTPQLVSATPSNYCPRATPRTDSVNLPRLDPRRMPGLVTRDQLYLEPRRPHLSKSSAAEDSDAKRPAHGKPSEEGHMTLKVRCKILVLYCTSV